GNDGIRNVLAREFLDDKPVADALAVLFERDAFLPQFLNELNPVRPLAMNLILDDFVDEGLRDLVLQGIELVQNKLVLNQGFEAVGVEEELLLPEQIGPGAVLVLDVLGRKRDEKLQLLGGDDGLTDDGLDAVDQLGAASSGGHD